MKPSSSHTFLVSKKITNTFIFKANSFFWQKFFDVEILSKQILLHRVHSTIVLQINSKWLLLDETKNYFLAISLDISSKIVFTWIFRDWHEKCSKPRGSHSQKFYKSSLCNKFVGQACNLIDKEPPVQVLSNEFHKIFKNIYFIKHLKMNDSENIYVICWKLIIRVLSFVVL